jgi:hypothetical protein
VVFGHLFEHRPAGGRPPQIKLETLQPLGEYGEMLLNEVVSKFSSTDLSFILNNTEILSIPFFAVSASLIYKSMIETYISKIDLKPIIVDYNLKTAFKSIAR